jgi:hypothetical protein
MKKLVLVVILLSLGFIFVSKAEATPLKGIRIEVCKYGLFSKLFGKCFEYQVEDSYATSSIWCYSSNQIPDGWICRDNNGNGFDIYYRAVTIKNLNSKNLEVIRHRNEYGHPWTYTDLIEPDKTNFVFHDEDYAFSITFNHGD